MEISNNIDDGSGIGRGSMRLRFKRPQRRTAAEANCGNKAKPKIKLINL